MAGEDHKLNLRTEFCKIKTGKVARKENPGSLLRIRVRILEEKM